MPQIEKSGDLQSIANYPVFLVCTIIDCYDENNPKQNVSVILPDGLSTDLSGTAFGKITAIYGHIDKK